MSKTTNVYQSKASCIRNASPVQHFITPKNTSFVWYGIPLLNNDPDDEYASVVAVRQLMAKRNNTGKPREPVSHAESLTLCISYGS